MKTNQRKVGIVLSYIGLILGYIISIIYTPIMLRILGQSEFGLYSLVSSIVAYLGVLNFGLGSAYIRYYSRYKTNSEFDKVASLNGIFLILYSIIGFIAIIAGTILALNSVSIFGTNLTLVELQKSIVLLIILVFNMGLSFPSSIFSSYLTSNEEFVFQKVVDIVKIVISPFVILPILFLGYGSVGLVIITTIINVTITAINITYCFRKLKMTFSFKTFDFKLVKEMFAFSSFIFINMIIDQVNWNVDKLIIARYRGTVAIAIYGIASQINSYYIAISSIISSVFIPRVHKLVNEKLFADISELFIKIGRIQFLVLILFLTNFIFFGKQFMILWVGVEYIESYYIGLLLLIPVTIPLIQNIGIEIQQARNMHQFRSIVYLFIAILNIIISIPLTKEYGAIGAAFGTSISLVIGNGIIMNWYYNYKVNININKFWKEIMSIVPSFILPIIIGFLITKSISVNNYSVLFLVCTIYSLTYLISIYLFALNLFEKGMIIRIINNFRNYIRSIKGTIS